MKGGRLNPVSAVLPTLETRRKEEGKKGRRIDGQIGALVFVGGKKNMIRPNGYDPDTSGRQRYRRRVRFWCICYTSQIDSSCIKQKAQHSMIDRSVAIIRVVTERRYVVRDLHLPNIRWLECKFCCVFD
jgi:hypothetical protein